MPTSPKKRRGKPGRPKSGRIRAVCRFSRAELDRIDLLRRRKPRGVYLGELTMIQPLNPFDKFKLLQPQK